MAGVTDRPFRMLCKRLGAGYAVSEMVTSRPDLWHSLKTSRRANHAGESAPIAVQIAGTDAQMMADAARHNIDNGAQIIDINMGCPAKKVCNKWAGSALMQDEALAVSIVAAVVQACAPHNVPVTLKMRTGWCQTHRNALTLARAFEQVGVQMLTVHGRTRMQLYKGDADWTLIAKIKENPRIHIPIFGNGDIDSPEKALEYKNRYGVDGIMIGRAAIGYPWIFREIKHYMATGELLAPPTIAERLQACRKHLYGSISWKGEKPGILEMRRHYASYLKGLSHVKEYRNRLVMTENINEIADILCEVEEHYAAEPQFA